MISPQGDPHQWAPPRTAGSGPAGGPAGPGGRTAGRIISVIAGAVVVLVSLGLLGAGGTALWAQTQRHGGYVDLGTVSYSTAGYALASDTIGMHVASGGWDAASALIGTVRIRVTPAAGTGPAFAGIAPAAAASRYLTGVSYATVTGTADHHGTYTEHAGSAPAVSPARAGIWTVQAAGPGTQTLTWAVKSGDWMVVAMNADGAAGEHAGQRGRHAARAALDRGRPAGRRPGLPGWRRRADRSPAAPGVRSARPASG